MPKKRRKLNKVMEADIALGKRRVEFITAIIRDIQDEEIQLEYFAEFEQVRNTLFHLTDLYDKLGFNTETEELLILYKQLLKNLHLHQHHLEAFAKNFLDYQFFLQQKLYFLNLILLSPHHL